MAEERNVRLVIDATDQTRICAEVGRKEYWEAIGYLSSWNMTFPICEIYCEYATPDLVAVYKDENGVRGYVIGAVWHGDHYGFHS